MLEIQAGCRDYKQDSEGEAHAAIFAPLAGLCDLVRLCM